MTSESTDAQSECCECVEIVGIDTFLYPYIDQNLPTTGRHIVANFEDDTIVVYQAFNSMIADYAVENQRFGGPAFSYSRMSWIKTNFLWMMYRSGWATKPNQNRILAVRITRAGFMEILRHAFTVTFQKSVGVSTENIEVRLQWDPDHSPSGAKQERKAIQLGLKGKILQKYCTEFIVSITDITDFVRCQHRVLKMSGEHRLMMPHETVLPVHDAEIRQRIGLDEHFTSHPIAVLH